MAVKYIDYVNGDDGNSGDAIGLAWKTLHQLVTPTYLVLPTVIAYAPLIQVSAKAPFLSVRAYVPSVKVSGESES